MLSFFFSSLFSLFSFFFFFSIAMPLQAPARPSRPLNCWLRSHQAQSSHLAAIPRCRINQQQGGRERRSRSISLRVRAAGNPLDQLRDAVARKPVAQKAVLRLLLSPGLTGTLAVAGCYLAKMSSPLAALLTPPTASDVVIGLACALPLVALDALLLWPDYTPGAPGRLGRAAVHVSGPAEEKDEEKPASASSASTASASEREEEEEAKVEEESATTAAAAEERENDNKKPKRPDPAVVEAGRLALLRSLAASGVTVLDFGSAAAAAAAGSSSLSPSSSSPPENNLFRRLRAASHAYSGRAVRSTLARQIPDNPLAEAALVISARAGTEMLARFLALRFTGGWVADRVVEAGGLAGEDALVALLALVRAPPDANSSSLGTAGEVLVLVATAVGLVAIGVAGVVAAEAEGSSSAGDARGELVAAGDEEQRRTGRKEKRKDSGATTTAASEIAGDDESKEASSSPSPSPSPSVAATLSLGHLALRQLARARADAALLDACLDAARLLLVGAAFVASGNHIAASLLATVSRELPVRRWLVSCSAERSARVRAESRREFERLVAGDERFAALRRGMEERRERRELWLKRQEELRSGRRGSGEDNGDDFERGDGKDEL